MIACDQIGRICYGVELEPKFVDVAVMRYMNQHGNSCLLYTSDEGAAEGGTDRGTDWDAQQQRADGSVG